MKIEPDLAVERAKAYFVELGVDPQMLEHLPISFETPTRINNYYNRMLTVAGLGCRMIGLVTDNPLLAVVSLFLAVFVVRNVVFFSKRIQEMALYNVLTKKIHISVMQPSTTRLTCLLIHEISHHLSQNRLFFHRNMFFIARGLELDYLFRLEKITTLDEAIQLLPLISKANYNPKYLALGFQNEEIAMTKSLKRGSFFGENYNHGMLVAGNLLSLRATHSPDSIARYLQRLCQYFC